MALGKVFPLFLGTNAIPPRCGLCPKNLLEGSGGLGCTAPPHRQREQRCETSGGAQLDRSGFDFVKVTVLPQTGKDYQVPALMESENHGMV